MVARQLEAAGVDHLFTLTGGHLSPLYDGLRSTGIRLVDFRHEQAAVHAADAFARVRRDVGVAAVTAGPGVTGAITGVANAHYAASPVLLLGGRNPFMTDGAGNLQEAPQLELLSPITKSSRAVYDLWRINDVLSEAIRTSMSPRAGPVFVDLPMDVLLGRVAADELPPLRPPTAVAPAHPDPATVAHVADLLAASHQPVVVVGSGAYWARAEETLAELASVADAPVYLNGMARGLLGRNHPFQVFRNRRRSLRAADVVLLLGADLDFRLGFGQADSLHPQATVVQVDPDPSRLGHNRHVEVGVACDIAMFISALSELAPKFAQREPRRWTRNVIAQDRSSDVGNHRVDGDSSPVDPRQFAVEVAEFLDEDATVIGDGGDIVSTFSAEFRPGGPGRWMDPGPFGCLGVGAPFAIGARLCRPDAQVAVVFGDGAFGFNGFELDSAVRQGLPFVGIVGNDGAWGEMRTFHEDVFGDEDLRGQHLSQDTSYAGVAVALGGHGERVERASQIKPALARAFDAGVAGVVDVVLDRTVRHRNEAVSGRHVARAYGGGDPDAFKGDTR